MLAGAISVKQDDSRFVFKVAAGPLFSSHIIEPCSQRVDQKSDEFHAYESLPHELKSFCPRYYGEGKAILECDDDKSCRSAAFRRLLSSVGIRQSARLTRCTAGDTFLMLENLVFGMKNPHAMDIKV